MIGRSILLYDVKLGNRRDAYRVLASTGATCVVAESLEDLELAYTSQRFSILVVDISGHRHLTSRGHDLSRARTIILSQEKFETLYSYLAGVETFTDFIAKDADGALPTRDLLVTVKKVLDADIFGVEKYLNWGATRMVFHLTDSATREQYIEAALRFCRDMKLLRRQVESVQRLCDEMLMNAFYDAPLDDKGNHLYHALPRSHRVVLEPTHAARLEVASDGERLAVSVADPYGALTRETVLEFLSRCFTSEGRLQPPRGTGGAGLGLFLCFNSVSSLIVNVSPGTRTEFIGLIDVDLTPSETNKRHPCFHYFSTNNLAPQFKPNQYRKPA